MSIARRKYFFGLLLLLGGGALIGWLYGHPDRGLLVASLIALIWHSQQLLALEEALRTRKFDDLPYGEGIWDQIFSHFSYLKQRSRRHKRRYQELLKQVRQSTNAMPDGAIVLDANFEVVLCNAAAKKLVGFKPRKDRGQRVENIIRDPHFVAYLKSRDFEDGVEIPSPVHDGNRLFCRLVPYGADQLLLMIRDITERIRLTTMRRDFVANASHELRSPLTVISGYLDTLSADPEVPPHWRKPVSQMQAQANRMNKIVAELLELSRLEGPGTATAHEVVDVAGLLAAAKNSYAGKPSTPKIQADCRSTAALHGSSAEIESLISNLMSNAIRHTPPEGMITLTWSGDEKGATLSVADTGEGIAEEYIPRLTERFFRVDPGRGREDGGVGLGLAIVKHILSRHDASLEISSTLGEGSRFSCHFPASRLVLAPPVSIAGSK
jgi:two-component system, OmpR family, phosphate regulon sensor histidine kinase PhoR